MGRRTSGQTVGFEKIGQVQADANTLTTTQLNTNINIHPNGTGIVIVESDIHITDQQALRLDENADNGSNYIAIRAAASMADNYTITWPSAVSSSAGFVLTSDASGNLSWASAGGNIPVGDPGAVATVHYPFFGTNAGALPATLSPLARANLTFTPSTGELFSSIGRHPDVIGSAAGSGTLTIRGTSSASKAAASILMTDNVSSSSTTTGTLVVTGGVGISTNCFVGGTMSAVTITETSSITLKENVMPITNALDKIMQLAGVIYDRKDGSTKDEAGLIAEDVNQVLPNLVRKDANGNPESIMYTKLSAYLIEAVKTLKQEINDLKGK
tara:strand:- start:14220 stop:15203 length:984 start_codon:yes stop_codon:yes gene_type:complete